MSLLIGSWRRNKDRGADRDDEEEKQSDIDRKCHWLALVRKSCPLFVPPEHLQQWSQHVTVVNLHFRCRAWQAWILHANHCTLKTQVFTRSLHLKMQTCGHVQRYAVYCIKWMLPLSATSHFKLLSRGRKSNKCDEGTLQSGLPVYHLLSTKRNLHGIILYMKHFFYSLPDAQCPYHCAIMFLTSCLPPDKISNGERSRRRVNRAAWCDKQ